MKLIDFLRKMGTPVNAPTTFEILDVKNKKLAKYQGILAVKSVDELKDFGEKHNGFVPRIWGLDLEHNKELKGLREIVDKYGESELNYFSINNLSDKAIEINSDKPEDWEFVENVTPNYGDVFPVLEITFVING